MAKQQVTDVSPSISLFPHSTSCKCGHVASWSPPRPEGGWRSTKYLVHIPLETQQQMHDSDYATVDLLGEGLVTSCAISRDRKFVEVVLWRAIGVDDLIVRINRRP